MIVEGLYSNPFLSSLELGTSNSTDVKRWNLKTNGSFSVKSFYSFLIFAGVRCRTTNLIWNYPCSKKINMIN